MNKFCLASAGFAVVFVSLLFPAIARAAPVLPHIYHSSINLRPYECTAAHNVTYWKNKIYMGGASICDDTTVWQINVANPDNLVYESGAGAGCKAYGVKVVEDILYAANWYTLMRTYDVTGSIKQLGEYFGSPWYGWNIDVSNNRAYVNEGNETQKKLVIMDVSNPATPSVISYLPLSRGGGLTVRGSYAYFTDDYRFTIANISDENNPYILSSIDFGHLLLGGVQVRGNYAYMYWSQVTDGGLMVFDISNPAAPVLKGQFAGEGATDMCLLGDYAFYPTSGNGFMTVDISDPTNPHAVAQSEIPFYALELCVTGNGRYAYVGSLAGDNEGWLSSFEVLDQDPDNAGPTNWSNCSLGEASWDLQYEGDALPTAANPAWILVEGSDTWAGASGGILRINDTGTSPGDKVKWARSWDATNSRGTTVLTRAKCASYSTGPGSISSLVNLSVRDGRYAEDFSILSDRIRAVRANQEYFLDGIAWHTYRITTQGSQFQVFVDEASQPVLAGPLFVTKDQDPDACWARVLIGSGSSPGTQDISFDYVHCFSNGAVGPSTVVNEFTPSISADAADVAGKGSLSGIDPATARVQWSSDGGLTWNSSGGIQWQCRYEATLLPSASTPNWDVPEGSESWASVSSGVLRVNDTSMDPGTKIKWSRDWNASPSIGTTVVARARCASVGGDTTFLGNIFVEDGSAGERFKIMTDRLVAAETGLTYLLDATQWHVYRITTKDGQFHVYVDENPAPVLTGVLGMATSNNRVMFGSGASAGTQDIYFDYVRYTAQGGLPPGQGDGGGPVTVTCVPRSPLAPPDRATVTAYDIPFVQNSQVLNRVRFSLTDLAGNVGLSPIYTVRIANAPPPAVVDLVAAAADRQVTLSWQNPSSVEFTGTMIRFSTTDYPAGPADGTLLVDRATAPGSNDSYVHTGLTRGQTYYYSAFAHDAVPNYAVAAHAKGKGSFLPDLDLDGDVDQEDFGHLQACFSGSGQGFEAACADLDFDTDGDVDQDDFEVFRACLAGADSAPGC